MATVTLYQRKLATNRTANETYRPTGKGILGVWWDTILNFFHPGIYCVERCGVYEGNYGVLSKNKMLEEGTYSTTIGNKEKGVPWKAFEGTYSECCDFKKQNQTCFFFDN